MKSVKLVDLSFDESQADADSLLNEIGTGFATVAEEIRILKGGKIEILREYDETLDAY